MEKIIRISHKDLNEYIQMYSEKKSNDKFNNLDSEKLHLLKLRDEETDFLLALLNEVVADDAFETKIISNIKNTLEKNKNEER